MKNPYQLLRGAILTALRRTRYLRREIKYRFHMRGWFPLRVQKTRAQFTVLTTVDNDVQHLDGFFTNLINQRVDFRNNLKVVVVVRRSTDGGAELVGKWREAYPDSITLLHEPDRTYLEAINKGLAHIGSGMVTFIDVADRVDYLYFYNLDRSISKRNDFNKAYCIYYSKVKRYNPAQHRVEEVYAVGDANLIAALNKKRTLAALTLNFSEFHSACRQLGMTVQSHGDTFLVLLCMAYSGQCLTEYITSSVYFERKRNIKPDAQENNNDGTILFPCAVYTALIDRALGSQCGLPGHIERAILSRVLWFVNGLQGRQRFIIRRNSKLLELRQSISTLLSSLDGRAVLAHQAQDFDAIAKAWLMAFFKTGEPHAYSAQILNFSQEAAVLKLGIGLHGGEAVTTLIDGRPASVVSEDSIPYNINAQEYFTEKHIRVRVPEQAGTLEIRVDDSPAEIEDENGARSLRFNLAGLRRNPDMTRTPGKSCWLFFDLPGRADDNAEHFYRYVQGQHPDRKIYFALDKTSAHWPRLAGEGFNLLEYGSRGFAEACREAALIIASHYSRVPKKYVSDKNSSKFVYLGHGVHKDCLVERLGDFYVRLLVTSIEKEHKYLLQTGNHYRWMYIARTGMPRHDILRRYQAAKEKIILIMPTWRKSLRPGSQAAVKAGYGQYLSASPYLRSWSEFLNSSRLKRSAAEHGYKIIFCPHHLTQGYLPYFQVPEHIQVVVFDDLNVQSVFGKSAVLITDYSSVAFDLSFLGRTILYYHFDAVHFQHSHYAQGYFDYDADGFGPVCLTPEVLLDELEAALRRRAEPQARYLRRMEGAFPHKDGKNCERLYEILAGG